MPEVNRKLQELKVDFKDRHRYLLRALTTKSLKIGAKSGLQDLVVLLNFNNFFSDS